MTGPRTERHAPPAVRRSRPSSLDGIAVHVSTTRSSRSDLRPWIGAPLGTLCSSLPAFLTGALAVQIRADLRFSISTLGLVIGAAFATAGLTSAPMGRMAQALGPGRALRIGLTGSAATMVLIAAGASRPWQFFALLGASGVFNSLNQPAANLLLADRIRPDQLGRALAVKQSGMPAAALLGGAAVPAIALTVGWRWAFVVAAVLAAIAVPVQPIGASDTARFADVRAVRRRPDMPGRVLLVYAAVGFLGAFTAGSVVNFLTSAATDAGIAPGRAGWLLSLGSASGILSRLFQGWSVDRRGVLPIQRLVWLLAIGAGGLMLMAIDRPATYLAAVVPAFAAGWAWPGLFNLSVIRNNPSAPASATGVSQVGIFTGAGLGPVAGGLIVEAGGYRPLWIVCAACLALGSAGAVILRHRIRATRRGDRR